MINYFRSLGYYALAIFDGVVNFIACIVGVYPTLDTASSFLVFLEMRKVNGVLGSTEKRRGKLSSQADEQVEEAKGFLDG